MRIRCVFTLLLSLVASCGGGGVGNSLIIDEVEPNNSFVNPQLLGFLSYDEDVRIGGLLNEDGRIVNASLDAEDWFAFTMADPEGTRILIELELSYFKPGFQLADNVFRLRVFFDGVELVASLDDFLVQPEVVEGDFATRRAVVGALGAIGDGELVLVVEAVTGGAAYTLTLLTQRE